MNRPEVNDKDKDPELSRSNFIYTVVLLYVKIDLCPFDTLS